MSISPARRGKALLDSADLGLRRASSKRGRAGVALVDAALILSTAILATLVPACLVQSVCYNDADCPSRKLCEIERGADSGRCRDRCRGDADCARGNVCELATGRCEVGDCLSDADCAAGFSCQDWRCVSVTPLRCAAGMAPIENQFCVDLFEASRPDADATDEGVDEARATSRAGVTPWEVRDNAAAQAACAAAGKSLCSERQWATACRGPASTTYGYGDRYQPATCNGIDKYCRCSEGACADADTCPYPHCYHDCGARFALDPTADSAGCTNGYGVFDMNGNLWEHVLGGDDTRVRGGAYNCVDSERLHRCDYVPTNWTPSARGFRCCDLGLPPELPGADGGEDGGGTG